MGEEIFFSPFLASISPLFAETPDSQAIVDCRSTSCRKSGIENHGFVKGIFSNSPSANIYSLGGAFDHHIELM